MNLNNKRNLGVEIKIPKDLSNKLLKELQNKKFIFNISSYKEIADNKLFYSFLFFIQNINQFLYKLNDIISILDDRIDIRIYIPKNIKDETKKPIKLPGDFIVYPINKKTPNIPITDKTILIDSGWAFGSGAHPSTIATLNEIVKLSISTNITNYKVLDIGTGTAILAIVLGKLGVKNIIALDIDYEAIKQAKLNIKLNKLSDKIKLINSSLEDLIDKDFDLIVANLTPAVLFTLISKIPNYVNKNGYIIIASPIEKTNISIVDKKINVKKISQSNIENWYAFTYKRL